MNRKLHSTVPMIVEQYIPKIPPCLELQQKEQLYRDQQKQRFDTRHKAYCLQPPQQDDTVWVPEFQQNATVLSEVAPCSILHTLQKG